MVRRCLAHISSRLTPRRCEFPPAPDNNEFHNPRKIRTAKNLIIQKMKCNHGAAEIAEDARRKIGDRMILSASTSALLRATAVAFGSPIASPARRKRSRAVSVARLNHVPRGTFQTGQCNHWPHKDIRRRCAKNERRDQVGAIYFLGDWAARTV
jgi:hypothetical protein